MTDENKKPYIATYLKSKKLYDEKLKHFYAKYPDIKPKGGDKSEKPMYSVDDPKYQFETEINENELESDLIEDLRSEE